MKTNTESRPAFETLTMALLFAYVAAMIFGCLWLVALAQRDKAEAALMNATAHGCQSEKAEAAR